MSGTLISLLDMTTYELDNLADGATVPILVAPNIDVTRWSHGDLLVRVHSSTITGSATLTVALVRSLPSPQDPSRKFEQSSLASKTIDANTAAAPTLLLSALTEPLGSFASLYIVAHQPTPATSLSATISVELALKS